jgi:hypothetical protein
MGLYKRPWTDAENERLKNIRGARSIDHPRRRCIKSYNRWHPRSARKLGTPFPPTRAFRRQWADTPSLWR